MAKARGKGPPPAKNRLPPPTVVDGEYVWEPIVRQTQRTPWGYYPHPEDNDIFIPDPEELNLLEEAKVYLERHSFRDVAAWLSEASGRDISYVGLRQRIVNEYKRKKDFNQQVTFAKRYRECYEKARRLHEARLDRKGNFEEESGLDITPDELERDLPCESET